MNTLLLHTGYWPHNCDGLYKIGNNYNTQSNTWLDLVKAMPAADSDNRMPWTPLATVDLSNLDPDRWKISYDNGDTWQSI